MRVVDGAKVGNGILTLFLSLRADSGRVELDFTVPVGQVRAGRLRCTI